MTTVQVCLRYRVTGLAAEAGFFALLSLPPLVLGLAASAGWIGSRLGRETRNELVDGIQRMAEPFLTTDVVEKVILPTFNDAIATPRLDLISLGFVLSVWSGSRALNVYIDTISIMYGLGGRRGIVRTRALSFFVYLITLFLSAVLVPLVVVGPSLIGAVLPASMHGVLAAYWPVILLGTVGMLASLYHLATPVRSKWLRDLPGALLAFAIWIVASAVMRQVVAVSVGGSSIYGPLATPIIVLIWLYLIALAVLIGAGLNAAIDALWPHPGRAAVLESVVLVSEPDAQPGDEPDAPPRDEPERSAEGSTGVGPAVVDLATSREVNVGK